MSVIKLSISEFIQQYPHVAEKYNFGSATQVIYVPPRVIVHESVYVQEHNNLCVVADEYARVSLVFDAVTDLAGDERPHSTRLYAHEGASITYTTAHTGSFTHHIELYLLARNANITVHGLYGITDAQQAVITTKQEHIAPGAKSTVRIKGIVGGVSRADYTGMITIAEQASQSEAEQQAATLLISPQARARSIPSLQVLTNDVRCKHGSAVGQLNQDQVIYAQSRGLSPDQAKRMLLHGFLAEATTHISPEDGAALIERILNGVKVDGPST